MLFDGSSSRVVIPTLAYKGAEPVTFEATLLSEGSQNGIVKLVSCPWGGLGLFWDGRLRFAAWDPVAQARTIVLVTHDLSEALKLAQRLVILNRGRLEQHGSCEEVLRQPATEYVRTFFQSQLGEEETIRMNGHSGG